MSKYFNRIFWGFVLILLDVNIVYFDILPDAIGYFMIASGTFALDENYNNKAFRYAGYMSMFLVLDSLIMFFVGNMPEYMNTHLVQMYLILIQMLIMYFGYSLYTGLIYVAKLETMVDRVMSYERGRVVFFVGFVITIVGALLKPWIPLDAMYGVTVVSVMVVLVLMIVLAFRFRGMGRGCWPWVKFNYQNM